MKKLFIVIFIGFIGVSTLNAQLIDSFNDENFTASPTWGGDTDSWMIVPSSDVAAGATNSNTLRLNFATSAVGIQYLSTQIATMASTTGQAWSFWIGRRAQAYTAANNVEIWLYANESNLESSTVDGYAILIGDDVGNDEIRLARMTDGTSASTIITSSQALTNGLTDIGFMIRVTRSNTGSWSLYTSTLPTANGSGAIATDIPNSTNVNVSQGTGIDNTHSISDNGYFGIVVNHSSGVNARATAELDQIYFETDENSVLPVQLTSLNAFVQNNYVNLKWTTATEVQNLGWEIERLKDSKIEKSNNWEKIGFVKGNGTTNSPNEYSFVDNSRLYGNYSYRLKQIDIDGSYEYSDIVSVNVGLKPIVFDMKNYPNPFNPETKIEFEIPNSAFVNLSVYNSLGEKIATLVDEFYEQGIYKKSFDGRNFPSGIYFAVLKADQAHVIKKMLLVK